jgi:hypothetical protein
MSQTIKCPNCKAELPSNTTICEWCNFVLNQEGDNSIENISADLEGIIKAMKGIEHPSVFSSFKKNAKISMPIFTIAFFLLSYKVSAWFAILGIFFLINSFLTIFKKSTNPIGSLKPLRAEFDEKVRNFQNLYGLNNKYKNQIQKYQNEWKVIENAASKGILFEWVGYGVLVLVFMISIFFPDPKSNSEINTELVNSESSVMLKIDSLIVIKNIELAKKELVNLKSNQNVIEGKSKIQVKELELALSKVENEIMSGEIDLAKSNLMKITWAKNSADYDSEQFEVKYFKQFIAIKSAVNEKLPEDHKITVETELDF